MIAAVALASLAVIGALVVALCWAVGKLVKKTEGGAAATVNAGELAQDLERAEFERDAERDARQEAERVAEHLAEELRHALANPTLPAGSGLAPGDVDNRVLRFYDRFAAARRARDPVPAGGDGALPAGPAPVAGGAPAAAGPGADPAGGTGQPG